MGIEQNGMGSGWDWKGWGLNRVGLEGVGIEQGGVESGWDWRGGD